MELAQIARVLRRRWLTGLIVFGLVAAAALFLVLRGTASSTTAATTAPVAHTVYFLPQGDSPTEMGQASQYLNATAGVWVETPKLKDLRVQAVRDAGVAGDAEKIADKLKATAVGPLPAVTLTVDGLPDGDSRKVLDSWVDKVRQRIETESRVGGKQLVKAEVRDSADESQTAAPRKAVGVIKWPIALLLGLVAGLIAMFVRDALDRRIRRAAQLPAGRSSMPAVDVDSADPDSASVRRLRALLLAEPAAATAVVTTGSGREDLRLARALAGSLERAGQRVALVDAGGVGEGAGLAALTAESAVRPALTRADGVDVVELGGAGLADAAAGPHLRDLLATLAADHDTVLVSAGKLDLGQASGSVVAQAPRTLLVAPPLTSERDLDAGVADLELVHGKLLALAVMAS